MPEDIGRRRSIVRRDQDASLDGFAEAGEDDVVRVREDPFEQSMIDASSQDRRGPDDPAGIRGETREPGTQDVGQRGRDLAIPLAGGRRGDELLGEERVAVRAFRERVEIPRIQGVSEDRLGKRAEIVPVEPLEVEALDPAGALQLGEDLEERMSRRQLVASVGGDDEDRTVVEAGDQVLEKGASRRIRPVEVLDREDERPLRRERRQEGPDGLVQPPGPAGLVVRRPLRGRREVREQPREGLPVRTRQGQDAISAQAGDEGSKGAGQRPERKLVAERDARSDEDRRPGGFEAAGRFGEEP